MVFIFLSVNRVYCNGFDKRMRMENPMIVSDVIIAF